MLAESDLAGSMKGQKVLGFRLALVKMRSNLKSAMFQYRSSFREIVLAMSGSTPWAHQEFLDWMSIWMRHHHARFCQGLWRTKYISVANESIKT